MDLVIFLEARVITGVRDAEAQFGEDVLGLGTTSATVHHCIYTLIMFEV